MPKFLRCWGDRFSPSTVTRATRANWPGIGLFGPGPGSVRGRCHLHEGRRGLRKRSLREVRLLLIQQMLKQGCWISSSFVTGDGWGSAVAAETVSPRPVVIAAPTSSVQRRSITGVPPRQAPLPAWHACCYLKAHQFDAMPAGRIRGSMAADRRIAFPSLARNRKTSCHHRNKPKGYMAVSTWARIPRNRSY